MSTVSLDVVTVAQDQRLRRSVFLTGLVVVLYDHLVTLESEIKYIWVHPVKRSSAWFLTFRYVALLSNLSMMAFFFGDFSPEEILIGCTLALRVCAMYGFNRRVFVSLGIAAVTTVALGIWSVIGPEVGLETTLPGCHVTTPRPEAIRESRHFYQATRTKFGAYRLVYDIFILCLTLRRAVTYHRSVGLSSGSLLPLMFRDGALYFGLICTVNLANIVMLYSGDIITAGSLAWFASAISVTMISRLMLNLHDAAKGTFSLMSTAQYDRPEHEHGIELTQLDPMQFRTSGMSLVGRV
ncbi:hypothetical protein B0H11DRAFT_2275486 [Mycena galericulata]|nr:hypothetical protein B0H11DRAFT_2275486 [Mycena galericulata]